MDKGDSPFFEPSPMPVNPNSAPQTSNKDSPEAKAARYKEIIDSLPANPNDLLKQGWVETTDSRMAQNSNRREFTNQVTKLKIAFDKGVATATGHRGRDHYHVYNPDSRNGKKDMYLDKNGNPVAYGSDASHIYPF